MTKMRKQKKPCEVCDDVGALLIFNTNANKEEIQRCDTCMKFKSDLEAWRSVEPVKFKGKKK